MIIKRFLSGFLQLLAWSICKPLVSIFLHYRVVYSSDWRTSKLTTPAILVANHKSFFDHVFIGINLSPASSIWPLGFLVIKSYASFLKYGPLALLVRLGGGVLVTRTERGKKPLSEVLKGADNFLSQGGVLMIFPEGKRIGSRMPKRGGRGTAYLALKHHTPIVPFFIEGNESLSFWKMLTRKSKITLHVGSPFTINGDYHDNDELLKNTGLVLANIRHLAP